MKTTNKVLATFLALGASACMAVGQDAGGPPPGNGPPPDQQGPGGPGGPGRHRPPLPLVIAALDANHDGVIDADEIANASAALKTLDKNNDGQLSMDELLPPRPPGAGGPRGPRGPGGPGGRGGPPPGNGQPQDQQGPGGPPGSGHRPPVPPIIAALDANHDGVIDADEIANASAALKSLDKNNDGKLTMDELLPPMPPRGNGPPAWQNDQQPPQPPED